MQSVSSNGDIIIRIPKKMYNKNVQRLITNIEFKKTVSKSKATQKEIDKLLADIKNGRAEIVKPLLDRIKGKV
jgi:ribosomal protein L17